MTVQDEEQQSIDSEFDEQYANLSEDELAEVWNESLFLDAPEPEVFEAEEEDFNPQPCVAEIDETWENVQPNESYYNDPNAYYGSRRGCHYL